MITLTDQLRGALGQTYASYEAHTATVSCHFVHRFPLAETTDVFSVLDRIAEKFGPPLIAFRDNDDDYIHDAVWDWISRPADDCRMMYVSFIHENDAILAKLHWG